VEETTKAIVEQGPEAINYILKFLLILVNIGLGALIGLGTWYFRKNEKFNKAMLTSMSELKTAIDKRTTRDQVDVLIEKNNVLIEGKVNAAVKSFDQQCSGQMSTYNAQLTGIKNELQAQISALGKQVDRLEK
jgi:hypothetical protein